MSKMQFELKMKVSKNDYHLNKGGINEIIDHLVENGQVVTKIKGFCSPITSSFWVPFHWQSLVFSPIDPRQHSFECHRVVPYFCQFGIRY